MKLKAHDQMHVSSVKADSIQPREEFEVDDATGKALVERGLATEVKAKAETPKAKADEPKAEKAPLSKASAPVGRPKRKG